MTGAKLALAQLPFRMRSALRVFRKVTGMTAVTSIATSFPQPGTAVALSSPVPPQCDTWLRSASSASPSEQWLIPLRSSRRSASDHSQSCPIGIRCSCVPIHLGGQLVGVAKLVADPGTADSTFATAISVLKLVVSETARNADVSMLSREVRGLRHRVADLQRIQDRMDRGTAGPDTSDDQPREEEAGAQGAALVHRALSYLQAHHQEQALSLPAVAEALGCNPKYLTTCFTRVVGEHMHTHLLALRVAHVCRLLIDTDLRVKEIAYATGFSGAGRLAGSFRRHVGVSPGEYRRIFSGS
jgi:AraC-like DNA-binding protein